MKKITAAAIILSGIMVFGCRQVQPATDYHVTVKIYTHATLLLWTYDLSPMKITVLRHPTGGGAADTVIDRALKGGEKDRIGRFLASFPLDSLDDRYASGTVTGNRHYVFNIRIGDRNKSIYVYYQVQKDLADLAGEIDRLLPKFKISYK